MKTLMSVCLVIGLTSQVASGVVLVNEEFSDPTLDPVVWNHGGGFFLNTDAQHVALRTFAAPGAQGFGARGDQTGEAGLDSNIGYASFTVTNVPETPIAGNFSVGNSIYTNTANSLVRVNFASANYGSKFVMDATTRVEVIWNTSGVLENFEMDSGWSGTIGGDSAAILIGEDPMDATNIIWSTPSNAAQVNAGDPANRFGFWISNVGNSTAAIIDDLVIRDTLIPVVGEGDFDGDLDVDGQDFLAWQENDGTPGGLSLWENNYPNAGASSTIVAVPEPATVALTVPLLLGAYACLRQR